MQRAHQYSRGGSEVAAAKEVVFTIGGAEEFTSMGARVKFKACSKREGKTEKRYELGDQFTKERARTE